MTWFASNAGGSSGDARGAVVCNYAVSSSSVGSFNTNNLAKLPYNLYNCDGDSVVYNDEIYFLVSSSSSPKLCKYNGTSWTTIDTEFPYPFYYSKAVVFNNEIHILGGDGYSKKHYKWNGETWSEVSKLPYQFSMGGCVVVHNNEINILGSGDSTNYSTEKHYKWNGETWTEVSTLPLTYQSSHYAYVDKSGKLNCLFLGVYLYKFNGTSWSQVKSCLINGNSISGGSHSVATYINNELYTAVKEIIYKYSYYYNEWFKVSDENPVSYDGGKMVNFNGVMYFLGGEGTGNGYNNIFRNAKPGYNYNKTLSLYLRKGSEIFGSGTSLFYIDENDSRFEIIDRNHFKFVNDGFCRIGLRDAITSNNLSYYLFSIF